MSLLPLRPLPVNGNHDGALSIRVLLQPNGPAKIYVRRESDAKTWICRVRSLLEIVSQDQQARQLDVTAVVTCLYLGIAYDSTLSTAFASAPLELQRRELGFTQPETWTDGSYRLTMRVALQGTSPSMAISTPVLDMNSHAAQAIPMASIADEEIVFGFTMAPTNANLAHVHDVASTRSKRCVTLLIQEPAFPYALLNWSTSPDVSVVRAVDDGVLLVSDGILNRPPVVKMATLKIIHAKGPALVVVSIKSVAIQPVNTTTYQPIPGSDVHHTIMQFDVRAAAMSLLQVAVLPGSSCVLEGSSLTIRERILAAAKVGVAGGKMGK